jgi:hypothetical protein
VLKDLSSAILNYAKAIVQVEIRSEFVVVFLKSTIDNFYNVLVEGLRLMK